MSSTILYLPLPIVALVAFIFFLRAIGALIRGDESYTLTAIDGLGFWKGKRLGTSGAFAMACVTGIVWITLVAVIIVAKPSREEGVLNAITKEAEELIADGPRITLLYFGSDQMVPGDGLPPEYRKVVKGVQEALPSEFQATILERDGNLLPAIRVGLPQSPGKAQFKQVTTSGAPEAIWHVDKLLGSQSASEETRQRSYNDYPPKGFVTFKARTERYVVHGLAAEPQVEAIQAALGAEEFVVFPEVEPKQK